MKRINVCLMAVVLMTTGSWAFAEGTSTNDQSQTSGSSEHAGMRRGGMMEEGGMILHLLTGSKVAEKLKLTDDQKTALQKVADDFKSQRKPLQDDMKSAMVNQAEILTSNTVDEATIMSAVEKAGQIHTDLAKLNVKELLAVKKILTADQIATLHTMREEFKKDHAQSDQGGWKKDRKSKKSKDDASSDDDSSSSSDKKSE